MISGDMQFNPVFMDHQWSASMMLAWDIKRSKTTTRDPKNFKVQMELLRNGKYTNDNPIIES